MSENKIFPLIAAAYILGVMALAMGTRLTRAQGPTPAAIAAQASAVRLSIFALLFISLP